MAVLNTLWTLYKDVVRDRPRIKVWASLGMTNFPEPYNDIFTVKATNRGRRPVTLNAMYILLENDCMHHHVFPKQTHPYPIEMPSLPQKLDDSQQFSTFVCYRMITEFEINNIEFVVFEDTLNRKWKSNRFPFGRREKFLDN